MQTFLPYSDFRKSLKVLDNKRLGKQRVEAYQIISAITGRPKKDGTPYKGWLNHPCTIMWKDYLSALKLYYNICIEEWVSRGFKNTMKLEPIEGDVILPKWVGFDLFHSSHRANLKRKDFDYYFSNYGWFENESDPYVWMDESGNWYKQFVGDKKRVYLN